jgi:hypothetical protein
MSTIIQIKRSANVTAPTTSDLIIGELAYSYDKSNDGAGAKLYIEALNSSDSEVVHAVGGKFYTDAVDGATNNNTASKIVKRDASGNFSAGTITANLFGNANTATRLATTRFINLSGDASGTAAFDGTGNADITVTVSGISSVRLGANTTGDYVANLTQGTGISLTNLGGESANVTISLASSGVTANTYGGASQIPVLTVDQFGRVTAAANTAITVASEAFRTIAVSGQSDIVADSATDTLTVASGTGVSITTDAGSDTLTIGLATSGVSAATYGGTNRTLVSLAVDSTGRITSAANISLGSIALGSETTGDYLSNVIAGTGITITNQGGETATPTITNAGVTSITGTANEIEVNQSTGSVTIGLPNNITVGGDLSITGNLYVTGNVVALPVENFVVEDSLIQLANNNISADIVDIGFYGSYNGDGGEHEHAGLFRDASDSGRFKLFQGLQGNNNLTSTINVTGTGFSIATLVANLTGGTVSGLSANIAVGDGGTGRGTLTTNAILYGQGTSAVGMLTGSAYQVLQLNASGVPVFGGIDGGSY